MRETEAGDVAEAEIELEAGAVEGAFEPVGKYNFNCSVTVQSEAPDDWPALG